MTEAGPSGLRIHAVAVVIGEMGVLIRGASGSGKSALAAALIRLATAEGRFARLVADDRVELRIRGGRLLAGPVPPLDGLLELRGIGIARMPTEPATVVRLVIDLGPDDPSRLPNEHETVALISDCRFRRLQLTGPNDAGLALWWICGGCDTMMTVPAT